MNRDQVISLGCRLNSVESEAIRGFVQDDPDLFVVNSCAVTNEAVRQTRQAIRRLKREQPAARIVVTGCAAQIEPATFAGMPEVAQVVANADKLKAQHYPLAAARGSDAATGFTHQARAFVAVQNGCDHRCTFCVIPLGRGAARSVAPELVVERIEALVDAGYNEVVLTGVDLTSWGQELPGAPALGTLVQTILARIPTLPRLRLSSIDCIEIDAALLEAIASEPRLMPHLHLSLQAGDDLILKRMKRRHSRADAVRICAAIRAQRPEVAIGADLIAGFPTESDTMFANSMALIDDCDIVYGHIFPYSPRAGTPAARMPQVAVEVRRERARQLRAAAGRRLDAYLHRHIGVIVEVLVELDGVSGHSGSFAPVRLAAPAAARSVVRAKVVQVVDGKLIAEIA